VTMVPNGAYLSSGAAGALEMRPRVPLAMFAVALLMGGCTTGSTKPPKKVEATTTTTSAAEAIAAARTYFRALVADISKATARDVKALAAAPVMTQQISNAYTQFANDALTFQSEVASYHWPSSAASDARNLVMALSAVAADGQLAASNLPTPNYNRDNDTEIADLKLLSADLGNT